MRKLLNWIFGRKRLMVIEVPDICGRKLCLSEVKAALGGRQGEVMLQSVLWLIVERRARCVDAAMRDGHMRRDASYQLGAAQSLTDVLVDLEGLTRGEADDEVRGFFAGEE